MICRTKNKKEIYFENLDYDDLIKQENLMKIQSNGDKEVYKKLFNNWINLLPIKE